MFSILNEHYQRKMGQPIKFADFWNKAANFNFIDTQAISQTLTLTQGVGGTRNQTNLMDKLLHLTYQGKFSLIDTVVQKVTGKATLRQLLGGEGRADLGPESD